GRPVGRVGHGGVQEPIGLILERRNDTRMVVAEVVAPPGRARVEVRAAPRIEEAGALAADKDRKIARGVVLAARVGPPQYLAIPREEVPIVAGSVSHFGPESSTPRPFAACYGPP